jgi:hypothetical protein
MNTMTSDSAIAAFACFAISNNIPDVATGSNPPVSAEEFAVAARARP